MWKVGKTIGDREGRMDVAVAAAGILKPDEPCLTYPAKLFQQVSTLLYILFGRRSVTVLKLPMRLRRSRT